MPGLKVLEGSDALAPRAGAGVLADRFGRQVRYLRLSVTDRCDLRCQYCMPPQGNPMSAREEILSIEEIARAVRIFRTLGVRTVRITGGEPLVRRGVVEIVRAVHEDVGIDDIALSTNATLLAEMARPLRDAGLRRVNVSLDSLRPEPFRRITRRGDLDRVLRGIDAAVEVGLEERKINVVAMRGLNDDEFGDLVDYAWERGYTPRFIELMPVGEAAHLVADHYIPMDEVRRRLGDRLADVPLARREGRGPARYLPSRRDPEKQVGFISAMSFNFCDGCNRVRLSTQGELRPCLASPRGVSLRDLIRAGAGDEEIAAAVRGALWGKDVGHHFFDAEIDDHRRVTMSGIGG
jgi:cyclic pyranopterin phosphate synthase